MTKNREEMIFTSDLTKFAQWQYFTESVNVGAYFKSMLLKIASAKSTPNDVADSAIDLLANISTQTDQSRYYSYSDASFIEGKNMDQINAVVDLSDVQKELIAQALSRNFHVTLDLVSEVNRRTTRGDTQGQMEHFLNAFSKKNWAPSFFTGSSSCFTKTKVAVLTNSSELSDETEKFCKDEIKNTKRVNKMLLDTKKINDYWDGLDKDKREELCNHLSGFQFASHYGGAQKNLDLIEKLKEHFSFDPATYRTPPVKIKSDIFTQNLKTFSTQLGEIGKNILAMEIDWSKTIRKKWDGSLSDDSAFDTGRAFYIIGKGSVRGKSVSGFIGLKSIYNAGNGNSFTFAIVKDIKNAMLFTDGAKYALGYGVTETDKLYVDMTFQQVVPATTSLSEVGQKVEAFINKVKLEKKIVKNSVQAQGESLVTEAVVPKKKNKI